MPDQETGELLQETLNRMLRLESELPVAATNGVMMSAAQLIERYSEPSGVFGLDEAIRELVSNRPPLSEANIAEPLERVLQSAGEAAREGTSATRRTMDALWEDTTAAARAGYRNVVTAVVFSGVALAIDGLMYLARGQTYVVALIEWIAAAA